MHLFSKCPKPPHCRECGVHFEPHQHKKYADLCLTHCKPHVERDSRYDLVMDFARYNWEKLEEQARAWKAEQHKAQMAQQQQQYNRMAEAQSSAMSGQGMARGAFGGGLYP